MFVWTTIKVGTFDRFVLPLSIPLDAVGCGIGNRLGNSPPPTDLYQSALRRGTRVELFAVCCQRPELGFQTDTASMADISAPRDQRGWVLGIAAQCTRDRRASGRPQTEGFMYFEPANRCTPLRIISEWSNQGRGRASASLLPVLIGRSGIRPNGQDGSAADNILDHVLFVRSQEPHLPKGRRPTRTRSSLTFPSTRTCLSWVIRDVAYGTGPVSKSALAEQPTDTMLNPVACFSPS